MRGKRGVSPLVATILLIAFAVALGAVIMQFGEAAVVGACGSNVQFQSTACTSADGSMIKFTITNKGSDEIAKVKVEAQGASSSNSKEYGLKIPTKQGREGSIQYSSSIFGELKGVKFVPVIGTTTCEQNQEYLPKVQVKSC